MAGRGPAPTGTARRRNKQPAGPKAAPPAAGAPEVHGPELGSQRPGYVTVTTGSGESKETLRVKLRWLAVTREWWQLWRTSPQAPLMTPTDWAELRTTALLYDDMWRGETKLAAEVRLRVAKFGATLEDRQRLRMTFGASPPRAAAPAAPAAAAPTDEVNRARERRERIAQRAAGGE